VKDEKNLDHSAGKQKAKYTLLVGDEIGVAVCNLLLKLDPIRALCGRIKGDRALLCDVVLAAAFAKR